MEIAIEYILLTLSLLFFISILAGKAGSRLGVPVLLLFLAVGMLSGSDGLGIEFENLKLAQTIGTVALCIILFSGGLDTKLSEVRPVLAPGVVLATVGVLLTAAVTGLFIWWLCGMTMPAAGIGFLSALLLASIMSSTDSASVFAILRTKGAHLKHNLRPLLELESGSNDPVAYILTITLIGIIKEGGEPNLLLVGGTILMQLVLGTASGYLLGKLAVFIINRIKIGNDSLYPILVFTWCIFIFSFTYFIKGNSYMAVYIGGLVIGNSRFVHKRSSLRFFDGQAWLSQILMFLTLGLLVNPHELIPVAFPALIIGIFMILVARPIGVFLSLLPFRNLSFRSKVFVSWVGLRGAVPIIFAIFPLAEQVPHARFFFNVVFFITLLSLIIQGTFLTQIAFWLGLAEKPKSYRQPENFDLEFSDEIKSATTEITITPEALSHGSRLMDMPLPDKTLAVMVKRGDKYFIPTGSTVFYEGDKLLIITDDEEALKQTYQNMGISNFSLKKN